MFAHRATLSKLGPAATSVHGSLVLATGETGEPSPSGLLHPVQSSIWYEWTSLVTGSARVGVTFSTSSIYKVTSRDS